MAKDGAYLTLPITITFKTSNRSNAKVKKKVIRNRNLDEVLDINTKIPGIPINVPTRGYTGGIMQVGVLHKEDVSDESKKIGQTAEPVILPLFGRPTYNGSNKWSYYTSTDKMNQVKLPISNKNKVCNSEYGCDELYDGDNVSVPAYNGDFKVSIYEFDKPRYIPYV